MTRHLKRFATLLVAGAAGSLLCHLAFQAATAAAAPRGPSARPSLESRLQAARAAVAGESYVNQASHDAAAAPQLATPQSTRSGEPTLALPVSPPELLDPLDDTHPLRPSGDAAASNLMLSGDIESPAPDGDCQTPACHHNAIDDATAAAGDAEPTKHDSAARWASDLPAVAAADATAPASKSAAWQTEGGNLEQSAPRKATPSLLPRSTTSEVTLEWILPDELSLGQPADCQLLVHNHGDAPAYDVALWVELPPGASLEAAEPPMNGPSGQLIWQLGHLAADEQHTVRLRIVPTQSGDFAPQAAVTMTRAAAAAAAVLEPRLHLEIAGPTLAVVGQPAECELVVTNPGSGTATNVVVEVAMDERLFHPSGPHQVFRVGMLAAGQSRRIRLPLACMAAGAFPMQAVATAGTQLRSDAELTIEVAQPELDLDVSGPGLRYVNRPASYTATVLNASPAPADNVQMIAVVPEGMEFVAADVGGAYDSATRQVAWFVGRLDAGETAQATIELRATATGQHAIEAAADADGAQRRLASATTRVEGLSSLVLEITDSDDPVEMGSETVYEICIANQGTQPAANVQIAATVPPELEPLDVAGPTDGQFDGQQIVFAPIASLAAGHKEVFRVRVRSLQAGSVRLRAFFRSDDNQVPVQEEEVTRVYTD